MHISMRVWQPLTCRLWRQVRKRPHLMEFLERCAELFEVVVFTASQKIYAQQLLDVIDPARCVAGCLLFMPCVFMCQPLHATTA